MVHVRTSYEEPARALSHADVAGWAEGDAHVVRADTLVSRHADGPFEKLAVALEKDGRLRDELAARTSVPCLVGYARLRWLVLLLATPPLLMLLELDRELVVADMASRMRLVVDATIGAYAAFELTRKTPRMPWVVAVGLAAVALRWALVATRLCGRGVHPSVYGACALAAAAAALLVARAPSRARVTLELLDKFRISRSEMRAATAPAPVSGTTLAAALALGVAVPAVLYAMRKGDVSMTVQALALLGLGAIGPEIARRIGGSPAAPPREFSHLGVLGGIFLGMAVTSALASGSRTFFDAGTELARCVDRLDEAGRRLLARESAELTRTIAFVRASGLRAALTVTVIPFAEERIYRGLVQETLTRRFGRSYGIFAAALVFGIAHVGAYEIALYQTIALGIGFGLAYAEGGLLAAIAVHALYNFALLI